MTPTEISIIGGVFAMAMGVVEIAKRLIDKVGKNGNNGKLAKVLSDAERKAIFDTDRAVGDIVRLHQQSLQIQMGIDKTLAIMAERQCPYGRDPNAK